MHFKSKSKRNCNTTQNRVKLKKGKVNNHEDEQNISVMLANRFISKLSLKNFLKL